MKSFDVEVADKTYHCQQMSALDADYIAGLLAKHDVLFYTSDEQYLFALISLFVSNVPHDERKEIAKECLRNTKVSDGEGGLMPVTDKNFNAATLQDYYQLVAKVLIANFQSLSSYLLGENAEVKKALEESVTVMDGSATPSEKKTKKG